MGRFPNKYVIGLTGNIATGKSVVRQMLQHLGAHTIDADSLTHQVMMPNAPAYKPIINTFGQFIVGADGRIDRAILGKMVFGNPEALKKLEQITHPIIRQAIVALIKRAPKPVVVVEAIKLLEGELAQAVDSVWVVNASPQTQYKRLLERRKMSEADAKQRILAQGAQADKLKQASVVIQNDGSVDDTWKQVQAAWGGVRQAMSGAGASAPTAAPAQEESAAVDISGISVKRGMPTNAQAIADFVKAVRGVDVTRMDIMMAFGEKSFLLAQDANAKLLGVIGWTVENLITRVDECHVGQGASVPSVVHALVVAVEAASKELESEVGFIFLAPSTPADVVNAFKREGYAPITLPEIRVGIWREVVQDALKEEKDTFVLWKQLRQDRVLQPI